MPHRTYLAESGAKRPTNDFSQSVTDGHTYGRQENGESCSGDAASLVKVRLRRDK